MRVSAAKPAILVIPLIPPELRRILSERFELVEHKAGETTPGFAVAAITSAGGMDRALMDLLPDLRLIACNGTGLDRVDLAAAAERRIIVRNTPDEVTEDGASYAIALILALFRRLVEADRFVRSGRWKSERMTASRRIAGLRVGIVGLGRIGDRIATQATALGMQVSYTGPREKADRPYRYVADVRALATDVDVLVLCCPGGPATRRMIGAEVLAALGPAGFLVNIARGEVVDQAALIAALQNGTIAGAGLDVFEGEPDIDPRLRAFENIVLAPHYAVVTQETRRDIATTLRDAITDFLAGKPVPDAAAGHAPRRAS
jgi:lactate dehydrogenase-like 2-hydroxyacid dehydrogenase